MYLGVCLFVFICFCVRSPLDLPPLTIMRFHQRRIQPLIATTAGTAACALQGATRMIGVPCNLCSQSFLLCVLVKNRRPSLGILCCFARISSSLSISFFSSFLFVIGDDVEARTVLADAIAVIVLHLLAMCASRII